jgi:hypothetical protein
LLKACPTKNGWLKVTNIFEIANICKRIFEVFGVWDRHQDESHEAAVDDGVEAVLLLPPLHLLPAFRVVLGSI